MRCGKAIRLIIALLLGALLLNLAIAVASGTELEIALELENAEAPDFIEGMEIGDAQGDIVAVDDGMELDDIPALDDIIDLDSLDNLDDLDDLADLSDLSELDFGPDVEPEREYDIEVVKSYLTDYLSSKTTGYTMLQSMAKTWDSSHAEYLKREAQYRKGVETYNKGKQDYEKGMEAYNAGKEKYEESLQQYRDGADQFREGASKLNEAKQKRDEGMQQLQEGEAKYEENLALYQDGVQKQSEAQKKVEKLPEARWVIMDCRGNSSFVQLLLGSSNLASLEMTFALMFVLVGALVIYATISKMIDEQRNLVGAGKALGLYNREIFAKYLMFGMTGTLLGTALGILTARFLMEVYVLKSAGSFYTFDTTKPALIVAPTLVALGAGGLLSLAATWFACTKLMRSTAIQLMQPKVPAGRKKAGGGKHILSLYSRLILLNIRSDLRRVIVTIVSVAGCCALVVIGFTLKSAVEGALQKQYDKVVNYDGRIKYDVDTSADAAGQIKALLDGDGIEYTQFFDGVVTFRIKDILVGELLCGDISQISDFYHLLDWKTNKPLAPSDNGILIQKRTAESYDLEVGSELELTVGAYQRAKVRVAGIFDNYIGRVMVMSRAYYRELFDEDCVNNQFYIRLNGADEAKLQADLTKIAGFESYSRSDSDKALFASTSTLVTAIVALFIFMAAVMAGVVLTNLTNTYILQKKRELTIMRINGFTVREVIAYVTRETVLTTATGIIAGVAMGAMIAYRITRALETAFVQYNRSVCLPAWAYGVVITAFFTIVINVIVLRKVRRLKLTDMG